MYDEGNSVSHRTAALCPQSRSSVHWVRYCRSHGRSGCCAVQREMSYSCKEQEPRLPNPSVNSVAAVLNKLFLVHLKHTNWIMIRSFNICWISYTSLWLSLLTTVVMLWVLISSVRMKWCAFLCSDCYPDCSVQTRRILFFLSCTFMVQWWSTNVISLHTGYAFQLIDIFYVCSLCVYSLIQYNWTGWLKRGGYVFARWQPGRRINFLRFSVVFLNPFMQVSG
jgi:hypothetical protein